MALIKCPECGKGVSDKANACVNCGYPIAEYVDGLKEQANEIIEVEQKESTLEEVYISEVDKEINTRHKHPMWKRWWFLTLACVFAPPVGIVLLWIAKKPSYAPTRTTVTAFLSIYAFIWCSVMFGEPNDSAVTKDISQTEQEVVDISNIDNTLGEEVESVDEYKESCEEYAYKDVLRNPDKYIGKRVKATVKVNSVHEKGILTPDKYYLASSNDEYDMWCGDWYGVFDCRESEDPKILDEDIITVYGEISEPQETKSLIVNSQEVFCIDMKYAELISE